MTRESLARPVFGTALAILLGLHVTPARSQNAAQNQDLAQQQAQQLDQILNDWFIKSKDIERLEGEHVRIIYDYVFQVAKRAKGRFYYESPDKGRIDLSADPEGQGKDFEKINPGNNQKVTLVAQPDQPERWICDGEQVLVIDDVNMTVQQFPLPPAARGNNIMDGPLPFLFGMPPEKAKLRYTLKVLQVNAKSIDLVAYPKWKQDAANYKWARIRIERATMLPMAIQMLDPPGTRETVYTFPRIAKNPKPGLLQKLIPWAGKDPFKPDLSKYDIQAADITPDKITRIEPGPRPNARQQVPSVVGFEFKQAQDILQKSGYTVKMHRGEPAKREELVYRVQKQSPEPKAAAEIGSVVALTLYMPAISQTGGETPTVTAMSTPKVLDMHWKEAEKVLTAAGLKVKFRQGRVAATTADVFKVYEQSPAAGAELKPGDAVILTLFLRQDAVTK